MVTLHLDLYLVMILLSRLISTSILKRLKSAICYTFTGHSRCFVVIEAFRSRELQKMGSRQIKRHCCTKKSSRAFTFQLFTPLNIIPTTLQIVMVSQKESTLIVVITKLLSMSFSSFILMRWGFIIAREGTGKAQL